MKRSAQSIAITGLSAIAMISQVGCSSTTSLQTSNFELDSTVAVQDAAAQPAFVVGDELGLMMFSQVALSPEASPTYQPPVIATLSLALHTSKSPAFDWIQNYLALDH